MIRYSVMALALLTACASAPPNAASEIEAWARSHYGDELRGAPEVFYGDFTGDGRADAFAWVTYNDGGLHNFGEGALFRNQNGALVFWRIDETATGESPRHVAIVPGHIRLTTTVLQDGDARCCPTGERRWSIRTR